jgi:hypothetical protein
MKKGTRGLGSPGTGTYVPVEQCDANDSARVTRPVVW